MLPEKGVLSAVVATVRRCTQLDWKRVPQARSRGCKSSVTITAECSRHHAYSILGQRLLPRDAILALYMLSSVFVCPSVCPSVRHKPVLYRNDWTNRAGFFEIEAYISHCVIRKCGYLKNRVLPSGTLSQTPDFKNFAMTSRSRCQQIRRCRRRRSSLLSTPNRLIPLGLLRFVVDLS